MKLYILLFVVLFFLQGYSEDNVSKEKTDKAKVLELLKKLSASEFEEREKATEDLKKLGGELIPILEEELKNEKYDPESIWRMEKILSDLRLTDFAYRNKKIEEALEKTFHSEDNINGGGITSIAANIFNEILGKRNINFIASYEAARSRLSISYRKSDKISDVFKESLKKLNLKYEIINGIVVVASEEDLKKYKENLKTLNEKPLTESFKKVERKPFSWKGWKFFHTPREIPWENAGINVRYESKDYFYASFSIPDEMPFKEAFFSFLAMYDLDFEFSQKDDSVIIKKKKE